MPRCPLPVARRTSRKFDANYGQFLSFFNRSAEQLTTMDPADMDFDEFEGLAEAANTMIEARRKSFDDLLESEQRLQGILDYGPGVVYLNPVFKYCDFIAFRYLIIPVAKRIDQRFPQGIHRYFRNFFPLQLPEFYLPIYVFLKVQLRFIQ